MRIPCIYIHKLRKIYILGMWKSHQPLTTAMTDCWRWLKRKKKNIYRHCPLVTNEASQCHCPARFITQKKLSSYTSTIFHLHVDYTQPKLSFFFPQFFYFIYFFSQFFQLRRAWWRVPVELRMASGIKESSWNNEIHCWIRSFRYVVDNRFWLQNTPQSQSTIVWMLCIICLSV